MTGRRLSCALFCSLLPVLLAAQQLPPRESRPSATTGGASISGVVMDDQTGEPVPHAWVRLGNTNAGLVSQISTDEGGRFRLDRLVAGAYVIYIEASGYPYTQYGARRPGSAGRAVSLGDNQQLDNVTIRLTRGAVITGVIRNPDGQPFADATVSLAKWGYAARTGERTLVSAGVGVSGTDDRGVYRLHGVPPGAYVLMTVPQRYSRLLGGLSAIGGPDEPPTRVILHRDVEAVLRGQNPAPAPPTRTVLSRTFYPGTSSASEAAIITVAAGEERGGMDLVMRAEPSATIQVRLDLPAGIRIRHSDVKLYPRGPEAVAPSASPQMFAHDGDGTFTLSGVQTGDYVITAGVFVESPSEPNANATSPPGFLSATARISVDGRDVTNLVLAPQPGTTVTGRVVLEGITPATDLLSTLRVGLTAAIPSGEVAVSPGPVPVDGSGRFAIAGVPAGRYRVEIAWGTAAGAAPSRGWSMKSAMVDGRDAADVPVEIGANSPDVVVTLSNRATEIAGTVLTSTGDPLSDYRVIVFTTDRSQWVAQSRRVVGLQAAADGSFRSSSLPPGEYFITAAIDVEIGQWFDPAFLQALAEAGPQRITLGEGEKRNQILRVKAP